MQTYLDIVVLVVIAKENEHVQVLHKIFIDENTWGQESGFNLELKPLQLAYKMEEYVKKKDFNFIYENSTHWWK